MGHSTEAIVLLLLTFGTILESIKIGNYDTLLCTSDLIKKSIREAVNHVKTQKALEKKFYLQGRWNTIIKTTYRNSIASLLLKDSYENIKLFFFEKWFISGMFKS